MMIKPQLIAFFGLVCLPLMNLFAQGNDIQLRNQIGVKYSLQKKWNLGASFRYDRNQNLTAFRRSNFNLSASYKLNKQVKLGAAYRFITAHTNDAHRFRVFVENEFKLSKKISIESRTMLQHDIKFLQPDYLRAYNPKWILRERISVNYDFNKKWRFSMFTEPFICYRDAEINLYRWRNGANVSYLYKKRHELSAGYFFQKGLSVSAHKNAHVFGIQYTFDLNKPKKKNKKKSSE